MPKFWVVAAAFLLDAAVVLVFATGGRTTHELAAPLAGLADTAWPFLVALALSWLVTRAWRDPLRVAWPGTGLWLGTVAGGVVLRLLSGDTAQLSFVVTTLLLLGAALVGWRLLAALFWRFAARSAKLGNQRSPESVEGP